MPLGRQLSKLFNPDPAKSYDPNREALFAQLLSSGSGQPRSMGSAIGDIAKFFVGSRGLKKQGQARDIEMGEQAEMEADQQAQQSEDLARLFGGAGLNVDGATADALRANPNVANELMRQARPQEAKPPVSPDASKAVYLTNPDTGETRPVFNQNDMQAAWSEGFRQPVEEPEAPRSFDKAREYRNPAGDVQWITNEAQRTEALGGGFAPYAAPKPAAAAPSDNIKPTNLTMPDGTVRTVQTRSGLAELTSQGAILPQGGSQQRPLTEKQVQAQLAADRMAPAMDDLFADAEGGSLFDKLADTEQNLLSKVPGAGNFLVSEDRQRAANYVREIVGAGLRFETGAAITEGEVKDASERYMPRPGDSPATIKQKRRAITNYLESIKKVVPKSGNEPAAALSAPDPDPLGLF